MGELLNLDRKFWSLFWVKGGLQLLVLSEVNSIKFFSSLVLNELN